MGRYVKKTLLPAEHVVFETRYHWLLYFLGVFGLFLTLISLGLFLVVLMIVFPFLFILRRTSEFVVTDKRVIIKTGWIARRTTELVLSKVESIDVNQGIFARLFNYGKITVVGTGGTRERFSFIAGPLNFRRAVQAQQL
jgi:uncharacterized membrane protein YdbT with pleckstrin-like domain